jgi:hypothetical protein
MNKRMSPLIIPSKTKTVFHYVVSENCTSEEILNLERLVSVLFVVFFYTVYDVMSTESQNQQPS